MAHVMMFDTLEYTKKLEAAGVKPEEAEAHAKALVQIFDKQEDHVSTKRDIDTFKNEMNLRLTEFKVEIIKWVIGISATQAALIISVLKFLH